MMKNALSTALVAVFISLGFAGTAHAQTKAAAPATAPASKEADQKHKNSDIARHRAIAAAHEASAKCLESGKTEQVCHDALRSSCKGLAIGKYCGMKHEH
jgi:hypothetical protein